MSITGPVEGPPSKVGVAVTDVLTGLYAAVAVLACLRAREQSRHGYAVDLGLLDCALAAQVNVAQAYLTGNTMPPRQGNAHLQIVPYELFATADGWLVLAVGNDGQWQHFCTAAGETVLGADALYQTNVERVRQREELVPKVAAIMKRRTTRQWQELLVAAEVPHAPVWDYADVFDQPQGQARGWRVTVRDPQGQPVDLLGAPFHITGSELPRPQMPPALGQHTDEILTGLLGLDAARVADLRRRGIV
jgi:crotonobetainyl-CoA:carnitine CoA-transferase CaiB-like acyl-CoA transferase